jgi:hypothetical protein
MKFHLEFDIKKPLRAISHRDQLFLTGSCFTENMGEKFRRYKFSVLENPNGILFNPVSVAESIKACISNKQFTETDLFEWNEGWHSWQHHSRFSGLSAAEALDKINSSTAVGWHFLKTADHAIITLGSAWVYTLTEKAPRATPGTVAANNHKAPADWFHRKLLTIEETVHVMDDMIRALFMFNPKLHLIFTISPVRHIREGVVENNRSKAVLNQAVHQLVEKFENAYYFPAYELVIDDLRDYRFYSEDLVHPNYQATQYVWEKFAAACMNEKTIKLIDEIHSIYLAYKHKPFNPSSMQHKNFLAQYSEKTKWLQEQHPYLNFQNEIDFFDNR